MAVVPPPVDGTPSVQYSEMTQLPEQGDMPVQVSRLGKLAAGASDAALSLATRVTNSLSVTTESLADKGTVGKWATRLVKPQAVALAGMAVAARYGASDAAHHTMASIGQGGGHHLAMAATFDRPIHEHGAATILPNHRLRAPQERTVHSVAATLEDGSLWGMLPTLGAIGVGIDIARRRIRSRPSRSLSNYDDVLKVIDRGKRGQLGRRVAPETVEYDRQQRSLELGRSSLISNSVDANAMLMTVKGMGFSHEQEAEKGALGAKYSEQAVNSYINALAEYQRRAGLGTLDERSALKHLSSLGIKTDGLSVSLAPSRGAGAGIAMRLSVRSKDTKKLRAAASELAGRFKDIPLRHDFLGRPETQRALSELETGGWLPRYNTLVNDLARATTEAHQNLIRAAMQQAAREIHNRVSEVLDGLANGSAKGLTKGPMVQQRREMGVIKALDLDNGTNNIAFQPAFSGQYKREYSINNPGPELALARRLLTLRNRAR